MKRRLFGIHAVEEALRAAPDRVATILLARDIESSAVERLLTRARDLRVTIETVAPERLDLLAHGIRHQGIAAIASGEYPYLDLDGLLSDAPPNALLVALDEVTDVHNLGAMVRSSVALGAHGLITLRHRAASVNDVVVRASAGATEHARIARVTNLAQCLSALHEEHGFETLGLDAEAESNVFDMDLTGRCVLVVGSEGRGLRRLVRERCSRLAKIPLDGPIASLNASVALGIALYEVRRQHNSRS